MKEITYLETIDIGMLWKLNIITYSLEIAVIDLNLFLNKLQAYSPVDSP